MEQKLHNFAQYILLYAWAYESELENMTTGSPSLG